MFEQFKENIGLARETAKAARAGLRSAREAWRQATPTTREVWLLVPATIVLIAVADHFSIPWYYRAAVLVLVVLGSWMRGAIRPSSSSRPQ
jgi:hypothetical protein